MHNIVKNYQPPQSPHLDILYEERDFIVVNKPSGLLSVAGKVEEHKDCVEYRVRMQFGWCAAAHRLDMDTSGIMVVARNKTALTAISRQFEKRQTAKTYEAVLLGEVPDDEGVIDLPLASDWPNRPKQMVCHERGKPSQTEYKVLKRGEGETRVLFTPITGRTHQLRVHAQALGHPILGDPLYATDEVHNLANRLLLHAKSLSFSHPTTGEEISINSATPF